MAKRQTQASYQARLDRVVDHIDAHFDEDIRPEGLSEVACLSSYHWHRIYVAMRGETIGATIRRLRLQRAADYLANSDLSIRKIAERAGYSGVDAFARAFREAYGKTPADYRATGSHAAFKAAAEAEDHKGFPVAIETLPATRCASVAHKGAYLQIDQAMGRLFTALAGQKLMAPDQAMRALFFDDPDLVSVEACARARAPQWRRAYLSPRRWRRSCYAEVSMRDCAIVDLCGHERRLSLAARRMVAAIRLRAR
jgi:AraC family transcriptional regulator